MVGRRGRDGGREGGGMGRLGLLVGVVEEGVRGEIPGYSLR